MTLALVRERFAEFAVKLEATPGTDVIAGTPANGDFVGGTIDVTYNPQIIQNGELTGSLDSAPAIVGGLQPTITIRCPLRGSGAAGTAPDWGKLLQACTYALTATAAAVGVPTAATAGTVSTITLAAPFVATAQAYRGMPLLLTGDQTTHTGITDYTVGRVATLADTVTAPTVSTLAQIPINNLYGPTSDESVFKTVTVYAYKDGMQWKFTGCQGTWSIELSTGGLGFLTFTLRGQVTSFATAAIVAWTRSATLPTQPRWVAGKCRLGGALAQPRRLMFDAGVQTVLPDNPEATEGYDPAVPINRDSQGSIDPLMNTASVVALYNAFKAGTAMTLMAQIGSAAGNRFMLIAPQAKFTGFNPGARDGLATHDISFQLDGQDSDLFLASY